MNVLKIDFKSSEAPQLFDRSLRETGFAVIQNHPINELEINRTYSSWANFFNNEKKMNYLFDVKKQEGYFPFKSENAKYSKIKDLKEFFHIFPKSTLPEEIDPMTYSVRKKLTDLSSTLLGWLQQQLPSPLRKALSMPLPDMIVDSEGTLFRIIHYPPLQFEAEPGAVRAAAHEDINLLTLLPAATAPGLQVKTLSGEWLDVACDPGNIIVNSGDMLQAATQSYYPSTTHQVINPMGEEAKRSRYSMPLFLHPRGEVLLSPNLTAKSYLTQRLTELGLTQ